MLLCGVNGELMNVFNGVVCDVSNRTDAIHHE